MNTKFEFKAVDCDGNTTIKQFECLTWLDATDQYFDFIRGCGYAVDPSNSEVAKHFAGEHDYFDTNFKWRDDEQEVTEEETEYFRNLNKHLKDNKEQNCIGDEW